MSTLRSAYHGSMALSVLAFALALTLGCEAVDVAKSIEEMDLPLEVWDFSGGMVAEKANWGAEGWVTTTEVGHAQFKGPVYLRVILPNDRSIEGKFELVRATRRGEAVEHVSMFLPALSAEAARDRVLALLASADDAESENNEDRLVDWYQDGLRSGPGEELNLMLSYREPRLMDVGINLNWVTSPWSSEGLWNISISLSNWPVRDRR